MSDTTENEMNTFLFSGHDFYTESRSKHYATIYISSQKSQHKKRSRAANYEISLQAVKNLLIFAPFSRPTSSFVGDCHKSEINANSCQR